MATQTTTTTEHAPASGGFPPFNTHTFPSQMVWLIITFVLLYALMAKWALPQVGRVIDRRQKAIADDFAEAERLKAQSDEAVAVYEKALADARTRAQAIANEERAREAAATEASHHEIEQTLNTKLAEAEKTIAATKQAAMSNVRGIAEDAARAIVARLIDTTPSDQTVANAVSETLKR